MIKFLMRIMIAVVIGAVLLSAAAEVYLKYKGTEVSVGPMGIVFLYEQSFIGDSYVYSDMEMPNGWRMNRLVTFNTSYFLVKAIFGRPIEDSVMIDVNGDGKVELMTTLKGEKDLLFKGIIPKDAIICGGRNKLPPERLAACESADEYYQNIVKKHQFKEKIEAVRGAADQNNQEEKKNEIHL
ncbi:MAG: hypothetical protein AAB851_02800 [Patescibacteria group bacterium]